MIASPEIKQKVTELTASITDPLTKMRALAKFAQHDIRYVAIELGIGGWQPHPAADIFSFCGLTPTPHTPQIPRLSPGPDTAR